MSTGKTKIWRGWAIRKRSGGFGMWDDSGISSGTPVLTTTKTEAEDYAMPSERVVHVEITIQEVPEASKSKRKIKTQKSRAHP